MADFNMGGMPPMGPPMMGMPPMGGGFGEMLSYNPGWFYGGDVAAASTSARRDKRLFSAVNSLEGLYADNTSAKARSNISKNLNEVNQKIKSAKASSNISKNLNEVNQLIKDHTKLVRYNYAMYLVLEKISELEKTFGDMPFPSDSIKAEEIQNQVDEALSKTEIEIAENKSPTFKLGVAFSYTDSTNTQKEFFNREYEKMKISMFIKKALHKRNNKNWRNDLARKCSLDFGHSMTCLNGFLYHNYNVYNVLLGNIKKDGFISSVNNIKEGLEGIKLDKIFSSYEALLNDPDLGKDEERVRSIIQDISNSIEQIKDYLNGIDLNQLFGPPAVNGMLPDPTDYNDLYMTYVNDLFKKISDMKKQVNKKGSSLINKFETVLINERRNSNSSKKNDEPKSASNETDVDEVVNDDIIKEDDTSVDSSDLIDEENIEEEVIGNDVVQPEPVQVTPVQPEPVQTSPVENEPVRKAPSQPKPVQKKVENTSPEHSHSDNVVRIKQEDLDFWRNLIDDYLAMQDEKKNDIQFVSTPEVERDMQLVEMLSNIDEDEVDFTNMKGFKR